MYLFQLSQIWRHLLSARCTEGCFFSCEKKNRSKNQNYLFPWIPNFKTERKARWLQLLERGPDPAFQIHFFFFRDNHHLYSKHHFLFGNASLAETLPSPVSRPVKSPTQIVFNRSFGIRDFSCLNLGIRDFNEKSGGDSGLKLSREVACRKKKKHWDYLIARNVESELRD